ncbi:MAG: polymer-forming cytoskeletal protein [Anaerolineae bacterium]|nr:polymer-forming cytoskeletal protein [Anaerolineae bacterium]
MNKINRIFITAAILIILMVTPISVLAQTPTPIPAKTINGDQIVIANTYRLESGDKLIGNLAVIGGTATFDEGSTMTGDVFLTGGTLTVSGTVNGDLIAIGGAVNIEDTANINGNISLIGATIKKSPLADINGEITEQSPEFLDFNFSDPKGIDLPFSTKPSLLTRMLQASLQALAMAALAVILGLLLPQQIKRVADTISKEPLVTGGVGLLSIVVAPIVLVLLTITIILIPVAILATMLVGLAILFGWVAIGYEIGQRLSQLFKNTWHPSIAAGIGVLLLGLVTGYATLIPCVGWLVGVIVAILGLGAVIISRFGSSKYANKVAQAVAPSAPLPPTTPSDSEQPQI